MLLARVKRARKEQRRAHDPLLPQTKGATAPIRVRAPSSRVSRRQRELQRRHMHTHTPIHCKELCEFSGGVARLRRMQRRRRRRRLK